MRLRSVLLGLALALGACAPVAEEVGTTSEQLQEACFVLCIQGYHQAPHSCSCIPDRGGGRTCDVIGLCIEGYRWDARRCGCLPDNQRQTCGDKVCPSGQVCCNASCGICTPRGVECTQQACF